MNETRVVGCIRVSTKEQAEGGHSLDAQRGAIKQFCRNKGWELVEIKSLMSHNPRSRVYVLSGILRCGYCGERMRANSGNNGVRYYRDKSQIQHLVDCPQRYVRADDVEGQLARLVQSIRLSPDWREEIVAAKPSEALYALIQHSAGCRLPFSLGGKELSEQRERRASHPGSLGFRRVLGSDCGCFLAA